MAHFANSSEGMAFDEECSTCKYSQDPCPIACMQLAYNYEACNNKTARKILDGLVKNDGKCAMKAFMQQHPKVGCGVTEMLFKGGGK